MTSKLRMGLFSTVLACCLGGPAAESASAANPGAKVRGPARALPVAVVVGLYKDFAWSAMFAPDKQVDAIVGPSLMAQSRAVLARYFEPDLTRLLLKDAACWRAGLDGGTCRLDFDLLFASQDPAAGDMSFTSEPGDQVRVSFRYPSNGQKIELRYLMKKTAAGWRIHDIVYLSMNLQSLRALLSGKSG